MICECCGKPRGTLKAKKSSALPGAKHIMCETCRLEGHEPKAMIIVAYRSGFNMDVVNKLIKGKKYCGTPIEARLLV